MFPVNLHRVANRSLLPNQSMAVLSTGQTKRMAAFHQLTPYTTNLVRPRQEHRHRKQSLYPQHQPSQRLPQLLSQRTMVSNLRHVVAAEGVVDHGDLTEDFVVKIAAVIEDAATVVVSEAGTEETSEEGATGEVRAVVVEGVVADVVSH